MESYLENVGVLFAHSYRGSSPTATTPRADEVPQRRQQLFTSAYLFLVQRHCIFVVVGINCLVNDRISTALKYTDTHAYI